MAVLPPPYTTTRRPSIGASSPSMLRSTETASRTCAASPAGMYARFPMCAPTARKTASKPPRSHRLEDVRHLALELERDAEVDDPRDLGVEDLAREPVLRDAVAHHPAGLGPASRTVTSWPSGRGGTRRRAPTGRRLRRGRACRTAARRPSTCQPWRDCLVSEEPLDGVDPDRLVELAAVADRLAGVVADPPHDRRERVVLHELAPGALVAGAALLGLVQPLPGCPRRRGRRRCTAGGGRTYTGRSVRQLPVLFARLEPTSSVIANGFFITRLVERARSGGCCGRRSPGAARSRRFVGGSPKRCAKRRCSRR